MTRCRDTTLAQYRRAWQACGKRNAVLARVLTTPALMQAVRWGLRGPDDDAADRWPFLVKALAILSKNRSPSMAGLASAHEQGLTDFDVPS